MTFDIKKIRAQTPGTQHVTHLLASGSGLMPQPVIDAVQGHIALEAQIGGYEAAAREADKLARVYESVARLVGAKPREIALVENATVAWCQAFYALPLKRGDRILTSEAEYAANYVAFLQREKRDGVIIDVIPSDAAGELDVAALETMIDDRVALIAITWVPTNGGLVNPTQEVGKIANAHGITYLLDACQAVGQMPVDVEELGCDFLSATARKFLCGPRGIGFLYVREKWLDTLEPAMIDHFGASWTSLDEYTLRDDARRFETWENAYALRAGLGAAAEYTMDIGLDVIQKRARGLAESFRERLRLEPRATIHDIGRENCAIVSFSIDGLDPRDTVASLRAEGINIGASVSSSTLIDSERRGLPTILRIAPHYYNTEDELDRAMDALRAL